VSADVDGPGRAPDGDAVQQDATTQPREGDADVTLESVAKQLQALDDRLATLERNASADTAGLQGNDPQRTDFGTPIRAAWDTARMRTVAAWHALRGDETGPTHRDPRTGEHDSVTDHPSNPDAVDPPGATPRGDGDSIASTGPSPPPRSTGRALRAMVLVVLLAFDS